MHSSKSLSGVNIIDVAEEAITIEVSEKTVARFAGGPSFDLSERQRNPFLGWETMATTISAYRLRNVVLDRNLMVLFKEGRLIAETNYSQSDASLAEARVDPERVVPVRCSGPVATCFDHWDNNYFHWTVHAIPTIQAVRRRVAADIGLMLPQLRPWQQRSLDLLGVSPSCRIETDRAQQYLIPEVYYCDYVAGRGDYMISPLSQSAYEAMSAAITAPPSRHQWLYIDRSASSNRRIPNEADLVARLAGLGFRIVRPEELSLDAQIALFRDADMVVAQLGAGLANIAFCRPGTVVYELVPAHHQNPCFLAMAMQGGLEYWSDVFETGVGSADHESSWLCDIDVDHVVRRVTELNQLVPVTEQVLPQLTTAGNVAPRMENRMSSDIKLRSLALKYGTDKGGAHSYTEPYEAHFARYRENPIKLLEIGIGGYDDPTQGGASLRMWSEYFPAARIFGLDLFKKDLKVPDNVSIYQGSQVDADLLRRISNDAGGFDIVIDDGSHINEHVITTFEILFPLLNAGGTYVVEDTQTSYWPVLGGSSTEPDSLRTMMGYFKNLIHGLNHAEMIDPVQSGAFEREIVSIAFYHNMIFIQKGDNSEPSNIPPGDALRQP